MIQDGKRALAYIVEVDEIRPIEGYDRVEHARTRGWWCVVKLGEMQVGDKAVYFEIDSKVPENDERFSFLESKHYKIKTQKMCKVYSQGLLMPLGMFPELKDKNVGDDVTDILGITYAAAADNARKSNHKDPNAKYNSMVSRNKKLFSKPFVKKLMRYKLGRKILFLFFGRKKDTPKTFPDHFRFVHKTDEERIENRPELLGYPNPLVVTEKLDGTSATYILERKKHNKFEFYVCSRNIRIEKPDTPTYHETSCNSYPHDMNIYWEMAFKYDIENHLKQYLLRNQGLEYVCLQGEAVGNVQGNPLKLKGNDLYIFNFIRSDTGRSSSIVGKSIVESWGMKWVPILSLSYHMPNNMETFKEYADAKSVVNRDVLREGIVLRDPETNLSFKNVSRKYLLKHGE